MLAMPLYVAGQQQAAGPIPPGSTIFHLLLAAHIAAGLTCVVTGAIAALSLRRPGRHPALAPWRLPPRLLAGPPGGDGGGGGAGAGAGSGCTSPA
jgi:hypothetical protein